MTGQDENAKQESAKKSDFGAAEEIKAILAGREVAEQERIIRWVGESLSLNLHFRSKGIHPAPDRAEEIASTPEDESEQQPADTRPKDIKSFVQSKQPKSDQQFVAVVAYHHRFLAPTRKDAITTEDLQEGARHSGHAVFKSPSTTMNNAVGQGYMDRGARGEYRLNAVGENLVAMTLPGSGADPKGRRAPKKRKAKNGKPSNGKAKGPGRKRSA